MRWVRRPQDKAIFSCQRAGSYATRASTKRGAGCTTAGTDDRGSSTATADGTSRSHRVVRTSSRHSSCCTQMSPPCSVLTKSAGWAPNVRPSYFAKIRASARHGLRFCDRYGVDRHTPASCCFRSRSDQSSPKMSDHDWHALAPLSKTPRPVDKKISGGASPSSPIRRDCPPTPRAAERHRTHDRCIARDSWRVCTFDRHTTSIERSLVTSIHLVTFRTLSSKTNGVARVMNRGTRPAGTTRATPREGRCPFSWAYS
jgi:hypothetical protein